MRKLLLYGYVTHYKGTKKVRISQHGLALKKQLQYNKKIATSYLQCKVKQIVRNSNTYVGFYFSAISYADLYA